MEFIYKENELQKIANQIIQNSKSKIIAFYAPMGAGKTTLIKALVKVLGGKDNVSSPTFGLVNEYEFENGDLLGYHFDFYRLKDEVEAMDMGLDDYLNTDTWVFIEWPEIIPNMIPHDAQKLEIEILNQETRKLTLHL